MPMTPRHDRPCAIPGLDSYRYRLPRGGYVMIGATDTADALREAARSVEGEVSVERLERWNGQHYAPVEDGR